MNNLFETYFINEYMDEYCTGVFSDELDRLGYKNQVSTQWKLNNTKARLFGKVRTLELEALETNDERIQVGLTFLGSLNNNEVFVVKGNNDFAYFGELMSRLSMEIGLAGVIIDGLTRDTFYTQSIELPIWAKGYSPVDIKGRGRVKDTDVSVIIDGITVNSGDYLFADSDSVVFIPQAIFEQVVEVVNEAAKTEYGIKQMIKEGKSIKEILNVVDGF
ncbi:RraA family protein [Paenibacillus sp. KS-LC4]|uniref:RraA family protein n=1 Tax=Paenibacillus sp. KS-LC4 TaxID=2979727 RepID=UPI0030D617D3